MVDPRYPQTYLTLPPMKICFPKVDGTLRWKNPATDASFVMRSGKTFQVSPLVAINALSLYSVLLFSFSNMSSETSNCPARGNRDPG